MNTINEITLNYTKKRIQVTPIVSSESGYAQVLWIFHESNCQLELKEYFFVLLLNHKNELLGYVKISEGGINETSADIRLTFATALKGAATGIIITHNHPSGNLKPSHSDILLTKKFKEAGKLLDIPVLDHLIITPRGYFSFLDEGLL
jgi:DNA repair protein RadC